ncbi:MAG TPA: cation-translocating P-type ATPase, partial [Acidimicrobiales bacterium]|nr:cation-translocating P-type ATPase [Acidimicrobiales bacterium]
GAGESGRSAAPGANGGGQSAAAGQRAAAGQSAAAGQRAAAPAGGGGRKVWGVDDAGAAPVLRLAGRACPRPDSGHRHAHATDEAVLAAASGIDDRAWAPVIEVPFESSRGYAASVGTETGRRAQVLVAKGAPEVILARCRPSDRRRAAAMADDLAAQGLRVLAVARKNLGASALDPSVADADAVDAVAQGMTLAGFVGLADTLRPSARPLVEQLVEAGIRVALITGDHPITARAIARQVGLPADVAVMTGSELAQLDEDARAQAAASAQVFARVSPEQKVQVVAALQRAGQVVAMVGDGANDAAAIRMADVGVGVSGRGSSAARVAADLVLTEDDLTALLDALVEGRSMWASVRDAVTILLGGNAGEVAFTVLGTALGGRAPVSTRQVLLVNLLTDMFPALAVAVTPQTYGPDNDFDDPALREARRRQFRREILQAEAPSLDRPLVQAIVTRGVATAAGASMAWAIGRWTPGTVRRSSTMGLTALVGTQLAQTLLTRRHSPLVVLTAVGSAAALVAIVQTPGISHFFGCTPLGPVAWSGVLGATAAATALSVAAPVWLARRAAPAPDLQAVRGKPPAAPAAGSSRPPGAGSGRR